MTDILKNIFSPDKQRTTYATVVRRLSSARYELENISGKIFYAESTEYYPVGGTVIVQGNLILGQGALAGQHRIYEV